MLAWLRLIGLRNAFGIVLTLGALGWYVKENSQAWYAQFKQRVCEKELSAIKDTAGRKEYSAGKAVEAEAGRGKRRLAAAKSGDMTPEELTQWFVTFYR